MNRDETFTLEMFIRVRGFGTTHADAFPPATRGGELLAVINTSIAELRGHATTQDSKSRASKEGTTIKGVALSELQDDLEAITRTARAIAITTPGLNDKFRMPRNVGTQKFLAAARAIAQDALEFKDEFIKRGLPATFLDDLNAQITEIEQTIDERNQQAGAGVAATAAIDDAVGHGMNAVRELDAIVRNTFRDDPATLAEWTSTRHIERAPKHKTATTTTTDAKPEATK
jgi:hypothetical protein